MSRRRPNTWSRAGCESWTATGAAPPARSTSWPSSGSTLVVVEVKARTGTAVRQPARGRQPGQAGPASPARGAMAERPRRPVRPGPHRRGGPGLRRHRRVQHRAHPRGGVAVPLARTHSVALVGRDRPCGRGRGGHRERAGRDDPGRPARYRAAGGAGPDPGRDRQQRRGMAAAEDHGRALPGQLAQARQLVRPGHRHRGARRGGKGAEGGSGRGDVLRRTRPGRSATAGSRRPSRRGGCGRGRVRQGHGGRA